MKSWPVVGQYRAIVNSASNTAISHTGKRGRVLTGAAAFGGAGLAWFADRRMGVAQMIAQPHEVGNFSMAIL
jgi:hypothetical protein